MTPKNYTLELSLFDLITVNPNFFYYKKVLLKVNKQKEVRKKQKKSKTLFFLIFLLLLKDKVNTLRVLYHKLSMFTQ